MGSYLKYRDEELKKDPLLKAEYDALEPEYDIIQARYKNSHTARRTFISALIDEGVNLNTVRITAGHSSEKTTLKNYTFDRKTEAEKAEKFEAALRFS